MEIEPKPGEADVSVTCSIAKLPDVAPGEDGKRCECLGQLVVPGLPTEAAVDMAQPLVSCRGHGWSADSPWARELREALEPICRDEQLRPYFEVYLDTRFTDHFRRVYGQDGWCEDAWVNFAAPKKDGKRRSGYTNELTDQLVDSIHRYSTKPVIVVSFGAEIIPYLEPERYPRLVLLHARLQEGMAFSVSGMRAVLLARVKVGVTLEEDMMLVSPRADGLLARTKEEIDRRYRLPMLGTHFLDRDPANEKKGYGNYLKFTIGGSPDPLWPRPTLRWGQAQASWTFWAFPFVGRWLGARMVGAEYKGVLTSKLGQAEDVYNVALWRENASKAWCLWQPVGTDIAWNNLKGQRAPGSPGMNSDPSRFPDGVPIALYFAWAEGNMGKYKKAFEALDELRASSAPPPKAIWHAGRFYESFADLKRDHPHIGCML